MTDDSPAAVRRGEVRRTPAGGTVVPSAQTEHVACLFVALLLAFAPLVAARVVLQPVQCRGRCGHVGTLACVVHHQALRVLVAGLAQLMCGCADVFLHGRCARVACLPGIVGGVVPNRWAARVSLLRVLLMLRPRQGLWG